MLFLTSIVQAAPITLGWEDPNNDPTKVGGYNLYYWQLNWQAPESVNVGKQTTYTLTDLEAGKTYSFAVTAYDNQGDLESTFSNEITQTLPLSNNTPVAHDGTLSTLEDTAANDTLSATDGNGDALTFHLVSSGNKGTVTLSNATTGAYTYTPNANATGADTFAFKVNDGTIDSNVATVIVTIISVNDVPVASDRTVTTAEDTVLSGALNATDGDGDTLTFRLVTTGTHITLAWEDPNNDPVEVTGYKLYYWQQGWQAPKSVDAGKQTIHTLTDLEAGQAYSFAVTAYNHDDATESTYSNEVSATVQTQGTNSYGTVTLTNATTGAYTYTPHANMTGTDTFPFVASDGTGDSNVATVTVTITPVNDSPVAMADTATTPEDTAVSIVVLSNDTDVDGDTLSVAAVTQGTNGTVSLAGAAVTYTPKSNFNGTDSFTYTVTDGNGGTATGTVTVTVTTSNDIPVASNSWRSTPEDTALTATLKATDGDGEALTFQLVSTGTKGTASLTNANTGAYIYTPHANATGSDTFTFKVNDGTVDSNEATVTITITAVNDVPVAVADTATTPEDTEVSIPVLSNDSDVDGDALSVASVTQGAHGVVATDSSAVTYTPNADFHGTDTFTYTVSDGNGGTVMDTVSMTIIPVNDVPVAESQSVTTEENTPVDIALAGSDIDDDVLTYSIETGPINGTLSGTPPTVTYTPNESFSGSDSFTFRANDGTTNSSLATIDITIAPLPDGYTGLVAAYGFDENSGDTVADASDHANHGTIAGAEWSLQGRFGKALSFDGVDDWVTIPDASILALSKGMTLEAWVYPTVTLDGWHTIIQKDQPDSAVYFLHASSSEPQPAAGFFINGEQHVFGEQPIPANTWTHLAATYDGNTLRLYVDGIEVASRPQTGQIQSSSNPFYIGGNSVSDAYFQGRIDEVRVYNRALSATEIQNDMYTPITSPQGLDFILVGAGADSKGLMGAFAPTPPHELHSALEAYWEKYNTANGDTRPALCDLDGDGRYELVIGLGSPAGAGWLEVKDDVETGYAPLTWLQISWPDYNRANGETFPACGDLDGDGKDEIVVGLGAGGKGWLQAFDDATTGFEPLPGTPYSKGWIRLGWKSYNTDTGGAVRPAIGNLDADAREELVLGLAKGGDGWVQILDDAAAGFAPLSNTPTGNGWVQVKWPFYNKVNGETRPAVCDLNGDGWGEIVLGLGSGSGGWVRILDAATGFAPIQDASTKNGKRHKGWTQVSWKAYNSEVGATWPACGDLDGDGLDELVLGLGTYPSSGGWLEIKDDVKHGLTSSSWLRFPWNDYNDINGLTRPTVGR